MKVLITFAHTFWRDSRVNKALLESIANTQNLAIHNLSEVYANKEIDIDSEIALLKNHDKIIFQFPLFWFSAPSLLKEWQDRVLTKILYNNPAMLKGKKFQIITTAGGAESSYDGHHGVSINELLSPINHSFAYSNADVLTPFVIYSASVDSLPFDDYKQEIFKEKK